VLAASGAPRLTTQHLWQFNCFRVVSARLNDEGERAHFACDT